MAVVREPNPYRPGFNQPPGVLAGRDTIVEAAREALDVAALDARTPRPLVLVGSRGVGKTVLLGEIADLAATAHGWLTVAVEIRPDTPFTPQLVERLLVARDLMAETPSGRRFKVERVTARAGVLGSSVEVSAVRQEATTGPPAVDRALVDVIDVAMRREAGLVIAVDELQLARRPELAELAATLQQHVPDGWPLVVCLAGLPTIRDGHRSVTYLERSEWHELGMLDHDDAVHALTGPAAGAGRPLTEPAADLLAVASGGYPYALQVLGHHAWRASSGADEITLAHAKAARPRAEADLATALYASRWADASDKEREYLGAVVTTMDADGTTTGAQVAAELRATAKEVSYLRDRLIKKGTLVAAGRTLRFPVPGLADWIRRLIEEGGS